MKRTLTVLFAVGTVAALVIAVTAWAKPQHKSHHKGGKTVTVIEHATGRRVRGLPVTPDRLL